MPLALDAVTFVLLIGGLLATGVLSGVLAGLLGVGGGIVIVPVTYWILGLLGFSPGISSHLAVGTSLATIITTSISSMRAHRRAGNVDTALLKLWGPGIFAGALLGGLAARYISGDGLRAVFGAVGLLVALNMAIPKTLVLAKSLPGAKIVNVLISGCIGMISALMGIGGGTLSVPTLAAFSVSVHRAVGTASALGFLIAVPAVAGFIWAGWNVPGLPPFSLGYVSLPAVIIIAPCSFLLAPFGARLAHALDARYLKIAFSVFLAITSLRMLMA